MNSRQLLPLGVTTMALASVIIPLVAEGAAAPYLWAAAGIGGSLLAVLALRDLSGFRRWPLAIAAVAGLSIVYWVLVQWPFRGASDLGAVLAAWGSAIVMGLSGIVAVLASGFENAADGQGPPVESPSRLE